MVVLRYSREAAALYVDNELLAVINCPSVGANSFDTDFVDDQVEAELKRLGIWYDLLAWMRGECSRLRAERRNCRSPTLGIFTG